jgi:hypothetical protein
MEKKASEFTLFTLPCLGDQIKESERVKMSRTHEENKEQIQTFG